MEQWVGILLGLIVVVAFVVAYMYRSSNFAVAPPTVISSAPATAELAPAPAPPAPAPAPAPAPPAPAAPAPEAQAPAPMASDSTAAAMASTRLSTTPVPPAPPAPPASAPSTFGVSTYEPQPMSGEFEPAYEGEYAEIEDNKLQDTQ
jgi:hypothetical protein